MVRYTLVPPTADLDQLDRVHQAVPANSEESDDCCQRIQTRVGVSSRERAQEWLVFLQAVDCVATDESGYYRVDRPLTRVALGRTFRENVYGVSEVLAVLDAEPEPLDANTIATRLDTETRERIGKTTGPGPATTESQLSRLLAWAVEFKLIVRDERGYHCCL